MPTLFQILFGRKKLAEQPQEAKIFNPLDLRVGNAVKIDTLELEKLNFNLKALREVNRNIDGENHSFVDYDLVARPFGKEAVNQRLRLVPAENDVGFQVILLTKLGECGWDEDFRKGLNFEENEGIWKEEQNGETLTYWRVNDVQTEYEASTLLLADTDGSGKVDQDEVVKGNLTYWDYWREFEEAGNTLLEFYFVEMDTDSGYFEFWQGCLIDPNRVIVA